MGQVLRGSARTTEAVRRAIQNSQASVRKLAKQYGINPKTVTKWKKRADVQDEPMGPKQARSKVLTVEEEALIIAFRRHTLLPLDDCLYALVTSPLPAASWDQPPARCARRETETAAV
jgi:transposase-like protein